MKQLLSLALLAMGLALLAACSSTSLDTPAKAASVESRDLSPDRSTGAGGGAAGSATASATPQSSVTTISLGAGGAGSSAAQGGGSLGPADPAALAQKLIYFDFDSFAIKDGYQAMLDAHAKALAANPRAHLVVEGHTDERGGHEYNLALGQKRAEAVVHALALLGAPTNQIEAISLGAEQPAVPGHDEAAWAKNRRAELKDR